MYTVTFADGTTFLGGTIEDSFWNKIPSKPITKIIYNLRQTYGLSGFEKYNRVVTKVITINPKTNQKSIIYPELFLMGLKNDMVYMIIIDLKTGIPRRDAKYWGTEYNGRKSEGWKVGESSGIKCQIGRIA